MILACTVFAWSTRVTDGQTDRRTELRWLRRAIAVPAVARKNRTDFQFSVQPYNHKHIVLSYRYKECPSEAAASIWKQQRSDWRHQTTHPQRTAHQECPNPSSASSTVDAWTKHNVCFSWQHITPQMYISVSHVFHAELITPRKVQYYWLSIHQFDCQSINQSIKTHSYSANELLVPCVWNTKPFTLLYTTHFRHWTTVSYLKMITGNHGRFAI